MRLGEPAVGGQRLGEDPLKAGRRARDDGLGLLESALLRERIDRGLDLLVGVAHSKRLNGGAPRLRLRLRLTARASRTDEVRNARRSRAPRTPACLAPRTAATRSAYPALAQR